MPDFNNECLVRCKNCNTVVTAQWGGIFTKGWKVKACPVCRKDVNTKGLATVVCNHCGHLVERLDSGKCLHCGKIIATVPARCTVECPNCSVKFDVPENHTGDFTCNVCGTKIPVPEKVAPTQEEPMYIVLPDAARMQNEGWAIWKHNLSSFPFKSRVQVSAGTFGLLFKDGVCLDPCMPGSHLLEDSKLSEQDKLTVALHSGDAVSLKTDIYCVLQKLPAITWGAAVPNVLAPDRTDYTVSANGTITYEVSDAKAYAEFLGYRAVKMDELVAISTTPGSKDGTLVELTRTLMRAALARCVSALVSQELVKPEDLIYRKQQLEDMLKAEIDEQLSRKGLRIDAIELKAVPAKPSDVGHSQRIEVRRIAETMINATNDVRVHLPNMDHLYADMNLTSSCRLKVADEETFFSTPEIQDFVNSTPLLAADVQEFFASLVTNHLNNEIAVAAQDMIDNGSINNITDRNQYVRLADSLRYALESRLMGYGLSVTALTVNLPLIHASAALRDHHDLDSKKKTLRRYVERQIRVQTAPISVHMKDEDTLKISAAFGCIVKLRIRDEYTYFNSSEAEDFLSAVPPVTEHTVNSYYVQQLTPMVTDLLSIGLQNIVNQVNADIRELHRFNGILKNSLFDAVNARVAAWGLGLESLDMEMPRTTFTSPTLYAWEGLKETRKGDALDRELVSLKTDRTLFDMQQAQIITNAQDDAAAAAAAKAKAATIQKLRDQQDVQDVKNEIDDKNAERAHKITLDNILKADEIDRLLDDVAAGKSARAYEEERKDYLRAYKTREEALDQQIREAHIRQEASIDLKRRERQEQFAAELETAQNQRALDEIMRKIAESQLTWKQKLDEYARVQRRIGVQDAAADVRLATDLEEYKAASDIRILREKNEAYYQVGATKIRLSSEEADLLERINRNAEDRAERQASAQEARAERRAILSFEQRMQDRRELVLQRMELVQQQYNQELALREKDDQLQKMDKENDALKMQLDYYKHLVTEQSGVEKAKAVADMAVKVAESKAREKISEEDKKAELERLEKQLAFEEKLSQRAEAYRKLLIETEKDLTKAHLDNEKAQIVATAQVEAVKAKSNAAAAVATAAAAAEDRKYDKLKSEIKHMDEKTDQRLAELNNNLGKMRTSIAALRERVNSLKSTTNANRPPVVIVTADSKAPAAPVPNPAVVQQTCPNCHQAIPVGSRFCPNCGGMILS